MNKLTKILAVVLIMLAAGLAGLAWWLGNRAQQPVLLAPAVPQASVFPSVAAARNIAQGTPITAADVKVVLLPGMASGAFRETGSVLGEVPLTDIAADAIITRNNLAQGLALKLRPGQRAVAIAVDETVGVGNKVEAGDYVDVFVTLRRAEETDKGQARLLASRWQVLAYGAAIAGQPGAVSGESSAPQAQQAQSLQQMQSQARSAVLAAPVDQVNTLLLAAQNGKITLALRHPADDEVADPALFPVPQAILHGKPALSAARQQDLTSPENRAFSGVSMASLAGSAMVPAPAPAVPVVSAPGFRAPPRKTLEVIRGNQREHLDF